MKTNLLVGSLNISSLCGDPENCLTWLIILLDIFAIFYLVFASFYKVTKLVRMVGWIWIGSIITADVIIVAIHPCILTLLCILFTIMIVTAMLSVVLPNAVSEEKREQKDSDTQDKAEKSEREAKSGSYVIRHINDKKYCFEIYDKQDKFLVRSYNCFRSVADAKIAVEISRINGEIANVEDRTVNWIKEFNHPKFELYKNGRYFYYRLSANTNFLILKSKPFKSVHDCKKQLDKVVECVKTLAVYISVEQLSAFDAAQYNDMKPIAFENKQLESIDQPVSHVQEVEPETKVDDGAVVINTGEKKTLWESYSELSKEQKNFFDGLRKAAQSKEGSREYESSSQLSYVLFKDKLMRIQIKRNMVEAIFMLMDSTFKQMQNAGDLKIKETKTVVKIENDAYYALALETLNKKYDLVLEQKAERESQRKKERLEKSRQKRLEKQGKN